MVAASPVECPQGFPGRIWSAIASSWSPDGAAFDAKLETTDQELPVPARAGLATALDPEGPAAALARRPAKWEAGNTRWNITGFAEAGALRHLDLDLRHLDLDLDPRFATAVAPRTRAGQEHQARKTRSPAYASQEQRRLEASPAPVLAAADCESDHVLASAVEPSAARKAAGWGHAALAALTAGSLFSVSRGAAYPRRDASGQAQPAPPAPCAGDMLATCAGGVSHAADMRWRSPFDEPAAKPDARHGSRGLAAAQQTRWEAEAAGLAEAERRGLAEMAAAARASSTGQERRVSSTSQAPRPTPVGHGFPYSGPGAGFPMLFGLHLGAA